MTSRPREPGGPLRARATPTMTRGRSGGLRLRGSELRGLFCKKVRPAARWGSGDGGFRRGKGQGYIRKKRRRRRTVCCAPICREEGIGRSAEDDGAQTAANLAKPQKGKTQRALRATFFV